MASCLFVGLGLGLVAPNAHAWGDTGHRVVGEIAWRHLTPAAQAAVEESLTDAGYEDLAEAATWPDTFARRFPEYDPMKPMHYVNVSPTAAAYQPERDCPSGCVVTALTAFVALLESQDPPVSLGERRRCVYWIAHLVGDIHQPLHIAHPDGKGGTATLLRFFEVNDRRSAHWIWDFGLIERRPEPVGGGLAATDQPPFRALAEELLGELRPEQVKVWQQKTSAAAIANESLAIAKRSAFLRSTDVIDEAYERQRWPIVAEQLQKAGVRLAAIFNRAFRASPAIP